MVLLGVNKMTIVVSIVIDDHPAPPSTSRNSHTPSGTLVARGLQGYKVVRYIAFRYLNPNRHRL